MDESIVKLFFVLIVFALLGWSVVTLFLRSGYFTWPVLKGYIIKRPTIRLKYILLTIAYAVTFTGSLLLFKAPVVNSIISLNYEEASKGENMNGSRYNMSEMVSEDVVKRALEKGAIENVSVSDMQAALSVYPFVQGSATEKTDYHISTEFILTYYASPKTKHVDAEKFTQLLIDSYREYLINNYADNYDILSININPDKDFENMSYFDICHYLTMKAEIIENCMNYMSEENSAFIASNGESFASISAKIYNLKDTRISNGLYSMIVKKGLSKNAYEDIIHLKYDNLLLDFDKQRSSAAFDINNTAIRMYKENMMRIVLVPTRDEYGEFYMGRTKLGLDQLSIDASGYSTETADYLRQIESNNDIISSLYRSAGVYDENVDVLIRQISDSIMSISDEANVVAKEYSNKKMNQCISAVIVPESPKKSIVFCLAFSCLFFAALLVFDIVMKIPKRRTDGMYIDGAEGDTFGNGEEL